MREAQPRPLPWRLVVLVATGLGVFSAFLSYTFMMMGKERSLFHAVYLNFTYWYAWALLTPAVVALAHRVRVERDSWRRAVAVHVPAALGFTLLHIALAVSARWSMGIMAPGATWLGLIQRTFTTNVDWEMMTYWAIVGVTHAVDYHREAQARALRTSRLETQLVRAQLQTLQRQLHPHFLFNTLNAIATLMHTDVEAADRMVARLSDLLRLSLEKVGVQEIPLKEELEFLEKYVDIERTRFRDRLTIQFDIEPEVIDAVVPSLILQPLVENAIVHGIGPIGRQGVVTVAARREGGMLWMEVRDNGAGLAPDALAFSGKRVGLANTRTRLEHLYGPKHRFEFHREGSQGLSVRVVIPFRVTVVRLPEEVA
jgi:signal transduction histidine kinase